MSMSRSRSRSRSESESESESESRSRSRSRRSDDNDNETIRINLRCFVWQTKLSFDVQSELISFEVWTESAAHVGQPVIFCGYPGCQKLVFSEEPSSHSQYSVVDRPM